MTKELSSEEVGHALSLAQEMWSHVHHGLTPEVVGNALIILIQTYVDGFSDDKDKQQVVDHLMKAIPMMMHEHTGPTGSSSTH